MDALLERRERDLTALDELESATARRIRVVRSSRSADEIEIEFRCRTVDSRSYPEEARHSTISDVMLPSRYPFEPPNASIRTPIFHPNVYSDGRVCMGPKWIPTEGLELFVRRLALLLTFDPSIVNEDSPANVPARDWYREARRMHPDSFPTDRFDFDARPPVRPKVTWKNVDPEPKIVSCPGCECRLRVAGEATQARCPRCREVFEP